MIYSVLGLCFFMMVCFFFIYFFILFCFNLSEEGRG